MACLILRIYFEIYELINSPHSCHVWPGFWLTQEANNRGAPLGGWFYVRNKCVKLRCTYVFDEGYDSETAEAQPFSSLIIEKDGVHQQREGGGKSYGISFTQGAAVIDSRHKACHIYDAGILDVHT